MKESARIDKWLWAARIYKTRSIAADACKNGRVTVGGVTRKPSFIIKTWRCGEREERPLSPTLLRCSTA